MGGKPILPLAGQPSDSPKEPFHSNSVPNFVSFAFQGIGPPSQTYIQRDDRLHVKILNSVVGAVYQVNARLLLPLGLSLQPVTPPSAGGAAGAVPAGGLITVVQANFTPSSDRLANEFDVPLAEGYLLSVALGIGPGSTTVRRGAAYATVGLQRGAGTGNRFTQLIADSPGSDLDLGWPGGPLRSSADGPGFIHSLQLANPAAGADFTFVAAAGQRLRVDSFQAQFAASATVATRNISIIVDDGANAVWTHDLAAGITASATDQIVATGTNAPTGVIATVQSVVLPPGLILAPGWRIRSSTANIQVGDQWSAIWFNVEEWINT